MELVLIEVSRLRLCSRLLHLFSFHNKEKNQPDSKVALLSATLFKM